LLLTARIVQAGGTATMVPLLMTSVMRYVPAHRRGATMGATSIAVAVAPALGPALGGAVIGNGHPEGAAVGEGHLGLILEPSGAVGLAAALRHDLGVASPATILTGGVFSPGLL
ncbi:MFS transporter, partial [Streptomyces acidicola]|uniref:MFS transporter n=1 Tax=Streptomyces acidicola TaxID=2596892 RepID=UPI001D1474EA